MYALYGKHIDGIVMVGGALGVTQSPMFYAGVYPVPIYLINNDGELIREKTKLDTTRIQPNYAVFFGMEDVDNRVRRIESSLGFKFELEKRIDASFLDDVFYRLNPRNNKNQTILIFGINKK